MDENKIDTNTVFLIDGSSFLYRAYHSMRPLHTLSGTPVNAVYGFCRMIQKIIKTFNPTHLAIVWDSKGKTVRHEIYAPYKATRQEAPSDLFAQKELIQEFAEKIGITQIAQQGVEADDLMYSAAIECTKRDIPVILITSDKDMYQTLTNKQVQIFDPFKDMLIDAKQYSAQIGFDISRLPLFYALLGDASDNIPGVSGIGKKGATELAAQFGSLDDLYANLDTVTKAKTRENLEKYKNDAFLSEQLFTLHYISGNYNPEHFAFNSADWHNALPLFKKLEFKSFIQEIEKHTNLPALEPVSKQNKYSFIGITTLEQLQDLIQLIQTEKICTVDTELNGLSPLQAPLIGLCLAVHHGTAYYIPFGHTTGETQLSREIVLNACKPWLEDKTIKKIMHHAKFDMLALYQNGITVQGLCDDTLLSGHLVTQDWQRVGLKYLSHYYLHEPMLSFSDVVSKNGYKNLGQVPLAQAIEYGACDAHQTLQLKKVLDEEVIKQNMQNLYQTIELPLIQVLFDMEKEGIALDTHLLQEYSSIAEKKLDIIRKNIIDLIGPEWQDVNLNSPKQLAQLLFEHLKLPPQKKTTGKTGYSTDQEVLEYLAQLHPVPQLIVEYRELFKLKSTYIDALPTYVNPKTGRIHSNFSQTAVATGRLASSDPNMQNIPILNSVCPEIKIRSAFKPKPGHVFISADYSQIELRVLAHFSQDPRLIQAFLNDEDIHVTTAANLFDVSPALVTNEQRQIGKRINFSILYGMTAYGLSKDLKIPFAQAKKYIEKYFAQFSQVSAWMDSVIEETKKLGYVTTYWSRRRYVPAIYEHNKTLYEAGCRIAINTKAQGTAAEIVKLGMIQLDEAFKKEAINAQILLQIHDELLICVQEDQAAQAEKIIKKTLESVVAWNVPLVVSLRRGANWHEVSK